MTSRRMLSSIPPGLGDRIRRSARISSSSSNAKNSINNNNNNNNNNCDKSMNKKRITIHNIKGKKNIKDHLGDIEDIVPKRRKTNNKGNDSVNAMDNDNHKDDNINLYNPYFEPPSDWEIVYNTIASHREQSNSNDNNSTNNKDYRRKISAKSAPVDTMGCHMLSVQEDSDEMRHFATFVSLLLSAQTKDAITYEAVRKLQTAAKFSRFVDIYGNVGNDIDNNDINNGNGLIRCGGGVCRSVDDNDDDDDGYFDVVSRTDFSFFESLVNQGEIVSSDDLSAIRESMAKSIANQRRINTLRINAENRPKQKKSKQKPNDNSNNNNNNNNNSNNSGSNSNHNGKDDRDDDIDVDDVYFNAVSKVVDRVPTQPADTPVLVSLFGNSMLTSSFIANCDPRVISHCISRVGMWRRKTTYLKDSSLWLSHKDYLMGDSDLINSTSNNNHRVVGDNNHIHINATNNKDDLKGGNNHINTTHSNNNNNNNRQTSDDDDDDNDDDNNDNNNNNNNNGNGNGNGNNDVRNYIAERYHLGDGYGHGRLPGDVSVLMSLPGIGPKMAHLIVQSAFGITEGIGVDVHVHRIAHRLGWVPAKTSNNSHIINSNNNSHIIINNDNNNNNSNTNKNKNNEIKNKNKNKNKNKSNMKDPWTLSTAEHTRKSLEDWLPKEKWGHINAMLVGFGQTICAPRFPKCTECPVSDRCPSAGK